jgi:hypothetical protein
MVLSVKVVIILVNKKLFKVKYYKKIIKSLYLNTLYLIQFYQSVSNKRTT